MRLTLLLPCIILLYASACHNAAPAPANATQTVMLPDTSFFVLIDHDDLGVVIPCGDSIRRHIYKEFTGAYPPAKYQIEIIEDSTSCLKYWHDNQWQIIDTLSAFTAIFGDIRNCTIDFPNFAVQDFNEDGYQDIRCGLSTNVNGNSWGKLFLFNPMTRRVEIVPSAEGNQIWAAPSFNAKDKTIECVQVSGIYGLSYESTYKLEGMRAIPIRKIEEDFTGMGADGKGGIKRIYRGKSGFWKLVKERSIEN